MWTNREGVPLSAGLASWQFVNRNPAQHPGLGIRVSARPAFPEDFHLEQAGSRMRTGPLLDARELERLETPSSLQRRKYLLSRLFYKSVRNSALNQGLKLRQFCSSLRTKYFFYNICETNENHSSTSTFLFSSCGSTTCIISVSSSTIQHDICP